MDPLLDFDPDCRDYPRFPSDMRTKEQVLASIQVEVPDEIDEAREAAQEKADLDFLVKDGNTSAELGSSEEYDSGATQSEEVKKGAKKRQPRFSQKVPSHEVEAIVQEAGPEYEPLPAECPPPITVLEVFQQNSIPVDKQARFVDWAREQVILREAEIADWHESQHRLAEAAQDAEGRVRPNRQRRAKWSVPKLRRNLLPPATREDYDRLQLGMRNYVRSTAPLVPQDEALVHVRPAAQPKARATLASSTAGPLAQLEAKKARRRLTDKRRRRVKRLMKETNCTIDEAREKVRQLEYEEELAAIDKKEQEELQRLAAAAAVVPTPADADGAVNVLQLAVAPAATAPPPPASTQDAARPKHRHDDSPDEQLRMHPNFLREARLDAARDSEMD